jgi:Kef-type K+ transport system membrane component KefB
MGEQIFIELSSIVILTIIIAGIAKFFKQPMIIAYIAAGLILSPYGLNLVNSLETINTLSQLGISFLLFMVGLSLSPRIIRTVGKISVITGLGQILFTSGIGFTISFFLGFSLTESIYIAIALTFSSTIVIMKLLSDKKDLETLYGKIAVGFLIVQDIVAMFILIFVSSLSTDGNLYSVVVQSTFKVMGSLAIVLSVGYYVLPKIMKKIADNAEFLMLFCIAWCLGLASTLHYIGLTIEIGALLAGVSLAISPYRHEIAARMRPLRDFFLLMFFVFLGTQMEFANFGAHWMPIIILSLFVLIGNPIIVMTLMGISHYTKRTSFLAGLTVAQISEFSLILVTLGIKVGHIEPEILSLVTVVGLITISGSTYFIIYGKKLYKKLRRYLKIFERKGKKKDEHANLGEEEYYCVLLGYNHIGVNLSKTLKKLKKKFLVVDYDPEIIQHLAQKGIPCIYEDVEDGETFEKINLKKLKLVVSSIKNPDINISLIRQIRDINSKCIVIVVSERIDDAIACYEAGANYVVIPNELGGHHITTLIEQHGLDVKKFMPIQIRHLEQLSNT